MAVNMTVPVDLFKAFGDELVAPSLYIVDSSEKEWIQC